MYQARMVRGFSVEETLLQSHWQLLSKKRKRMEWILFSWFIFGHATREIWFFITASWFQGNSNIALGSFSHPYVYWFLWQEPLKNCCLCKVLFFSTLSSTFPQVEMNRYVVGRELTWFVLLRSYFGKWEIYFLIWINP